MRKTYEECAELGNNQSIDDVVNQYHILKESVRHLISRHCFSHNATDEGSKVRLKRNIESGEEPSDMEEHYQVYFSGVYEVECDGTIWVTSENYDGEERQTYYLDDIPLDKQIAIACDLEDTNEGYDD